MALSPGTKLGPYEITGAVGAGGMGEVYRARDTRLGREVAIKVLPEAFAKDAILKGRFEREAKTISSLNHPNICTLYDVGNQDGTEYLVMELLEGENLAQRLARAPLSIPETLRVGMEIADALERAHRQGIVHRDLKPANVVLTKSGAKLLDFGLAKPSPLAAGSGSSLSAMATHVSPTRPVTREGTIVGTFQYMSPEQVEGREADARSDIFALGAVLYEMVTGKRAFEGKSSISVASAILEKEPEPISRVQPMTPPALEHVVKTCLAKDAEERFQTAHDVRLQLRWISEGGNRVAAAPVAARQTVRRHVWMATTALFALTTGFLSVAYFRARPAQSTQPVARFASFLPAGKTLALANHPSLALSPDGGMVAYAAEGDGLTQLYLRPMDQLEGFPLNGTDGASSPFFSPDGQWVGYFAEGKLKKVSVRGGPSAILAEAPDNRGACWAPDDTIVFTPSTPVGLSRVSAAGGTTQVLTTPDAAQGERTHRWPEVLPGGKAVVITIGSLGSSDYYLDAKLAVLSLSTGKITPLPVAGTNAHYSPSGHLVFAAQGGLFAVPFDLHRLEVTGAAFPVLEGVMLDAGTGAVHYALSRSGSLAFVPGSPQGVSVPLSWVSRQGVPQPLAAPARPYGDPHLSPDGKRLAIAIRGAGNSDIWVYEIARNTLTRLTFEGSNKGPVWTPDGKKITYSSERVGATNFGIYCKAADGSGVEERLTTSTSEQLPQSWSPDGRFLAFTQFDPKTQGDIWLLPMDGDRQPRPFLKTPAYEERPAFSPDGRWLAYGSSESGLGEVYVQAFPGPGGKWQISSGSGEFPVWARNGRELFYYSGSRLMSVAVATQPTFTASTARPLFEGRPTTLSADVTALYGIAPDGQHFIMAKGAEAEFGSRQVQVVLNWMEELKRRVPAAQN
jgi:eukaryotic-like serine/threonine-protein kinase